MKTIWFMVIFILVFPSLTCEDTITVHVIPHTHDDAGWIWTFDQYYKGTGGSWTSVRTILNNMIPSLLNRKDRTFIYVEIAFFKRWYIAQPSDVQNQVKDLLKEGRFEFINGGFVMHDEAGSYYQHFIDQMRIGLQFLKKEFNYKPDIAWFIDPFGHSAANAQILSKMGFDKIVLARIDYKEKDYRIKGKNLEFYWKPLHDDSKIFTHIAYEHYCPPPSLSGFLKDYVKELSHEDIVRISKAFFQDIQKWNSGFKHKNVLLMYGCDFTFNAQDANFVNIEKIMDYVNSNMPGLKVKYSTPSKYFKAVLKEVEPSKWTEYQTKDFFPYADFPYSYWTGYFTSRPFLKGIIRETGNYLSTSSKLMMELALQNKQNDSILDNTVNDQYYLRERLAICQHHDAVAGTAKQKVSEDYENMLTDSITKIKETMKTVFKEAISQIKNKKDIKICLASHLVDFKCNVAFEITSQSHEEKKLRIALYNPNIEGKMMVTIEMNSEDYVYQVYNDNNVLIESNFVCIKEEGFLYRHNCLLQFNYNFQKERAITTIILNKTTKSINDMKKAFSEKKTSIIENENNVQLLEFDGSDLKFNLVFKNQTTYSYSIKHGFYTAYDGSNSNLRPAGSNPDGAYVFSPVELNPPSFQLNRAKSFIYKGKLGSSIVLRFEQSYLIISILTDPFMFQLESIWDPVIAKGSGMNYLLLVQSDIQNEVKLPNGKIQPEFWTDSSGTIMLRRFKDYREGFDYNVTEKVAANFYPVNYAISMRDRLKYSYSPQEYEGLKETDKMITIYTERPESGGTMNTGELILILNRYSTKDDGKGLEEAMFEKSSLSFYFKVRHLITFGTKLFSDNDTRKSQEYLENYLHNIPALFSIPTPFDKDPIRLESQLSSLIEKTDNIIVNFHFIKKDKIFIQFYNHYDKYFTTDPSKAKGIVKLKVRNDLLWTEYEMNGTEKISSKKASRDFLKEKLNSDISKDENGNISFEILPEGFRLFRVHHFLSDKKIWPHRRRHRRI